MPGRVVHRKLNETQEGELRFRVLDILNNSEEALSIDQIKSEDIVLGQYTSQKLTRVLCHLIEMGLVRKGKSKHLNRMVYKAVSKMIEQGYDIEDTEAEE